MREYTEDKLVQETTVDFLQVELGWEAIYAYDNEVFDPSGNYGGTLGRKDKTQSLAPKYLREALLRLNTWLSDYPSVDQAVADAIRFLESHDTSLGMIERNREKYLLMRDGVSVNLLNHQGHTEKRTLKIFDFDQPHNNSFIAVREMIIERIPYARRPDIVGLVNGLPLVFMELKNVGKALRLAYDDNLSRYKQQVPQLFDCNGFIILANGVDAKIGSLSSRYEHFYQWKRLTEDEAGCVDMEVLLRGVCGKANLIDLFENFILFDDSSGSLHKTVARNHQFLGVNSAVEAVPDRKERGGKLGVFWHTQGSGKSYSMVFYAAKIHRKFGRQFTFLICIDRDDLDAQIYNTFVGCGLVDPKDKSCHAESGANLKELLGQHKAYIFTLIQKFNQKINPESPYSRVGIR